MKKNDHESDSRFWLNEFNFNLHHFVLSSPNVFRDIDGHHNNNYISKTNTYLGHHHNYQNRHPLQDDVLSTNVDKTLLCYLGKIKKKTFENRSVSN